MSEQERIILQYLEHSYTGARAMDDISAMTRIARAIEAFEADPIEDLPTAKPRTGKWEVCNILDYAQRPSGRKILRCPVCGYLTGEFRSMVDYYHKLTHFCPNCGVEMEGGKRWKSGELS